MKVLVLLIALASISAQAKINYARGEWGSGGGNALVCFKQVIEARGDEVIIRNLPQEVRENGNVISDELIQYIDSIELFDLYEAKKRRGLNPNPPKIIQIKDNENAFEYVKRVSERFKSTVPYMEEIVKFTRAVLPNNNFIMESSAVRYQNDLGSVVIPNDHCVISTMAVQVNYNKFYKVHIDGRLFNHAKHSRLSQATLVLHETVYAFARARGQNDSGTTRELVKQYITSGEYVTEGSVARALYNLDFDRADNEQWVSEFAKIYNESQISFKIFGLFENFIYGASTIMFDFYSMHGQKFLEHATKIDQAIDDYQLQECTRVSFDHNVARIYEAAVCVEKSHNVQNPADFRMIQMDIANKESDYRALVLKYYSQAETEFLFELALTPNLTTDDELRAVNNFDTFLVSLGFSLGSIANYNEFDSLMEDSEKRTTEIFAYMFGNICVSTSTGSAEPLPIPTNEVAEMCVQPLLLNNIVLEL